MKRLILCQPWHKLVDANGQPARRAAREAGAMIDAAMARRELGRMHRKERICGVAWPAAMKRAADARDTDHSRGNEKRIGKGVTCKR